MAHRMAKTVNLSDLLVVTGGCSDPGQSFVAEKLEQVPSLITEVDTCPQPSFSIRWREMDIWILEYDA